MPINWPTSLREALNDRFYMGAEYESLAAGDRSKRGYYPAKYRFEQIPSIRTRDGGRALDDAVNRYATPASGLEFSLGSESDGSIAFGLGWAFVLTIRYYCEHGGAPIVPEASQIASRQATILGRTAFESQMFSVARALITDLPLQVQNILLGSGVLPPDIGREGIQVVSLDADEPIPSVQGLDAPFLRSAFTNAEVGVSRNVFIDTTLELDPLAPIAYIRISREGAAVNALYQHINPYLIAISPAALNQLAASKRDDTANRANAVVIATPGGIGSESMWLGVAAAKNDRGYFKLNIAGAGNTLFTDRKVSVYW